MAPKRIGSGNAKRRRRRSADGGARPASKGDDLDELYVDDMPAAGKPVKAAPGPPQAKNRQRKKKGGARAADRRRARGEAPVELAGPETRASMQRKAPFEEQSDAPTSISRRRKNLGSSARVDTSRVSLPAGVLDCVKGPEEGLVLQLIEGEYTIGRGRDNNFVLKDIAASRQHLRLVVDGTAVLAVDLGSGNGTRVNGKRIREHALRTGDRVEIGNSVLEFKSAHTENTAQVEALDDATAPPPSEVEHTAPPAPPMSDEADDDFVPVDSTIPLPAEAAPRDQVLAAAAALMGELEGPPPEEESLPRTTMARTRPSNPTQRVPALDSSLGTLGNNGNNGNKDTSSGLSAAVPSDLWADGETATRMPNVAELLGPEEAQRLQDARSPNQPAPVRREPQGVRRQKPKPKEGRGLVIALSLFAALLILVAAALISYRFGLFGTFTDPEPVVAISDDGAGDAEFQALILKSQQALTAKDYSGGRTYAEEALRLRAEDPTAKALLDQALLEGKPAAGATASADDTAKDDQVVAKDDGAGDKTDDGAKVGDDGKKDDGEDTKVAAADAQAKDDTAKNDDAKAATDDGAKDASSKGTAKPDTAKADTTKKDAATAAKKDTTKKASAKKVAKKPTKKKKVTKKRRRRRRASKRPTRKRVSSMSAAEAEKTFKKAIRLYRNDDIDTACALLNKVAKKAPSDSPWKVKAKSNLRRCE